MASSPQQNLAPTDPNEESSAEKGVSGIQYGAKMRGTSRLTTPPESVAGIASDGFRLVPPMLSKNAAFRNVFGVFRDISNKENAPFSTIFRKPYTAVGEMVKY
jgi:hypothetical protein